MERLGRILNPGEGGLDHDLRQSLQDRLHVAGQEDLPLPQGGAPAHDGGRHLLRRGHPQDDQGPQRPPQRRRRVEGGRRVR